MRAGGRSGPGGAALHLWYDSWLKSSCSLPSVVVPDVDVVATDVGDTVAQAGKAVRGEVDGIGHRQDCSSRSVEVGPVGVGEPDRAAAVTDPSLALVEAVVVVDVAIVALVGQREGMPGPVA